MNFNASSLLLTACVLFCGVNSASCVGVDIFRILFGTKNSKIAPAKTEAIPNLPSTLSAMESLLNYFMKHGNELNLDAVYVTGMARDQLVVILNKLDEYPRTSFSSISAKDTKTRLNNLIKIANDVTTTYLPVIKKNQPDYYEPLKQLCTVGFWNFDVPSRPTDSSLVEYDGKSEQLDSFGRNFAENSDKCLSEATQTESQNCKISDHCWKSMTGSAASGYVLIHQVMYMEVVQRASCDAEVDSYIRKLKQGSIDKLYELFCAHALADVKLVETLEEEDTYKQDIFMEEALLCGLVGFRDFFRASWLSKILTWQKSEGCYGIYSDAEKLRVYLGAVTVSKRQEKLLPDDCMAHKSAVAIGVLSQYVRYLLEDPDLTQEVSADAE